MQKTFNPNMLSSTTPYPKKTLSETGHLPQEGDAVQLSDETCLHEDLYMSSKHRLGPPFTFWTVSLGSQGRRLGMAWNE